MKKKNVTKLIITAALGACLLAPAPALFSDALGSTAYAAEIGAVVTEAGSIDYVDANGNAQTIAVPANTQMTITTTNTSITFKGGNINQKVTGMKSLTLNNVIVKNLVPFYIDSLEDFTINNSSFNKGIDISICTGLKAVTVKDSYFYSADYTFAIHSCDQLTDLNFQNINFDKGELRIYSNKNLASTKVKNSVFNNGNVHQYSNKRGYFTDYQGTQFNRSALRTINSGGMSNADIFYLNKSAKKPIADVKYDVAAEGTIYSVNPAGVETVETLAPGENITSYSTRKNVITLKTSTGRQLTINDPKGVKFTNVKFDCVVAMTSSAYVTNMADFAMENCETRLIDLAYLKGLRTTSFVGTSVSQSSGYLSVYNNKGLQSFNLADSEVKGSSGYVSVYGNSSMSEFTMANNYLYGYLSAYRNGATELKINNTQFDDYIATDANIIGTYFDGDFSKVPGGLEYKDQRITNGVNQTMQLADDAAILVDTNAENGWILKAKVNSAYDAEKYSVDAGYYLRLHFGDVTNVGGDLTGWTLGDYVDIAINGESVVATLPAGAAGTTTIPIDRVQLVMKDGAGSTRFYGNTFTDIEWSYELIEE